MSKPTTKSDEQGVEQSTELQHVIADRDGATVCTIFPQHRRKDDLSTEWLTATADAFVSLDEYR